MKKSGVEIGSSQWNQILTEGAAAFGIMLEARQLRLMTLHAVELIRWNRRVNLTRITTPVEVAVKHFLDSLTVVPLIGNRREVLDMGSGGGFPGLPLKVAVPDVRLTLVDSMRKKISFLKYVIRQSGLEGVEAVQARIEQLGKDAFHSCRYDLVVSRALAPLDELVRLAAPFLLPRGVIVALKARRATEEVRVLAQKHRQDPGHFPIKVGEVRELTLPVLNLQRWIVVLENTAGR